MPSFAQLIDMTYCTLCDHYFPGNDARAQHVQLSTNHPRCETCDKRFPNGNSLRNHWVCSPRHNYCAVCERDFDTPAGFRVHVEFASVHRDDSDDDDLEDDVDDDDMYEDGWEDALGATFFPDENEAEAIASDDESVVDDDEDYWEDEDDTDFEDDEAPVPRLRAIPGAAAALRAAGGYDAPPRPRNNSADSNMSDATDTSEASNMATGSVSDDEDDHLEPEPLAPAPPHTFEPLPNENGYEGIAPHEIPPTQVFFTCALCLEAPNDTSATRCGHVFCTPCINTALHKKKACPVCREVVGFRQLRRIYLSAN